MPRVQIPDPLLILAVTVVACISVVVLTLFALAAVVGEIGDRIWPARRRG